LGFSFKAGTDDLRESPIVEVIESLLGKGYEIKIYDRNVNVSKLIGSNKGFILNHIPHIARLMVDSVEDILAHAELIVIGNAAKEFTAVIERVHPDVSVIDLVRISDDYERWRNYDGICW
jgi:GDP-mannose 6-dehydrogenase